MTRIAQKILDHLHVFARQHEVRLLYACETGSRGWGFASPDSDYDVRFIFVHSQEKYLSVNEPPDSMGRIFEDAGDVLDFNGWDLRKTLKLLRKSNATPFEWLQSPCVYFDPYGFRDGLWAQAPPYFSPRAATHHYLGICHKSIQTGIADGQINIKKYFYILRPLLAAKWAAERRSIPPMAFQPLLEQIATQTPLMRAIRQLWQEKEQAQESHVIPLVPVIQQFIEEEMAHCRALAVEIPAEPADAEALNIFFRQQLSLAP